WPRPVRIDPFLPIEAQRVLGMPRATPQACVADACEVQAAWAAQSGALVLSWPKNVDDAEVDGSAVVPEDLARLPLPRASAARAELQHRAAVLEPLGEDPGPPVDSSRA